MADISNYFLKDLNDWGNGDSALNTCSQDMKYELELKRKKLAKFGIKEKTEIILDSYSGA